MNNFFDEKICIEEINHFTLRFKTTLENTFVLSEWTKEHIYFCLVDYFKVKEIEPQILNSLSDDKEQCSYSEKNFMAIIEVAYKVYNNHSEYNIDNDFCMALSQICELFGLSDFK